LYGLLSYVIVKLRNGPHPQRPTFIMVSKLIERKLMICGCQMLVL